MKRTLACLVAVMLLAAGCSSKSEFLTPDAAKVEEYCVQVYNPVVNSSFRENMDTLQAMHSGDALGYFTAAKSEIEQELLRVSELNGFSYIAKYVDGNVSQKENSFRVTAYLVVETVSEGTQVVPMNVVLDFTWDAESEKITSLEVQSYV